MNTEKKSWMLAAVHPELFALWIARAWSDISEEMIESYFL